MFAGLLSAAVIAVAVGCWASPIGQKLDLVDWPDAARKLHGRPTPLVGGLMVVLSTLVYFIWLSTGSALSQVYYLMFAAAVLFCLGFVDDRRHLAARVRLVVQVLTVLAVVLAAPGFMLTKVSVAAKIVSVPLGPLSLFVSVFAVVGLINATNMADGVNGLAAGLMLIWLLMLSFYSPSGALPLVYALIVGLAVAWCFNIGGRLFMGDSGIYSISGVIGLLSILAYNTNPSLTADMVLIWFLIPVVDCLRLIVFRISLAQSPFASDRNHLHHILVDAFGQKAAVAIYLGIVAALSLASSLMPKQTLTLMACGLALYAWAMIQGRIVVRKRSARNGIG